VQLEAAAGDVATNLQRIEALVDEAAAEGARLIAIPEFCTSQIRFDACVHGAVLPADGNPALALFRRLAHRHQCWLGGSMLVSDGGEVFNRYYFVEPSGTFHSHDKDLPTMWEGSFYRGGRDDGAFRTGLGGVGAAVCWELIRTQTVRRLRGHVDVAMTGTHWWSVPSNWGFLMDRGFAAAGQYNRYLSEGAPAEFARRLGVPVLQASHCGHFRSGFSLVPGLPWQVPFDAHFVGATQIVDNSGHVLAQRFTHEGPGVVCADIELGARAPVLPLEERFWIPELPWLLRGVWSQQNACGRSYYRSKGRTRGIAAASAAVEEAVL
jgi:predicted amidohydrolase